MVIAAERQHARATCRRAAGSMSSSGHVRVSATRRRRSSLLALVLTVFAIIGVVVMLALVVALPSVARNLGISGVGTIGVEAVRWVLLAALLLFGLGVLMRYGPQRRRPQWRWITPGAIVAL